MKEQRDCIITELLQTEKDYVSDLKLLNDTFLRHPEEAKVRLSMLNMLLQTVKIVLFFTV